MCFNDYTVSYQIQKIPDLLIINLQKLNSNSPQLELDLSPIQQLIEGKNPSEKEHRQYKLKCLVVKNKDSFENYFLHSKKWFKVDSKTN